MLSNHQKIIVLGLEMILCCFLAIMPGNALSQDASAASRKLVVGTVVAPPLYEKTEDGQWQGFGIEIWQAVAQRMGVLFEFREYRDYGALQDAIKNGEVDAIPAMPVEERYEPVMDFSQSYLRSGLAIAVPAEGAGDRWTNVIASIFSRDILGAVGLLMLVSLIAGIMVWAFERRQNSEMFGDGTVKGISHGVWWSVVTMTTVGYGDKAPKTIGGRVVGLIWMLFSIVFISCFTANITTSLTISELRGKVRGFNDLYSAKVGSISRSEASDFLTKQGLAVNPFENIRQGLQAVADKKVDAFVLNELILKHLAKTEFAGRVRVIPGTFDEYYVSIAMQDKSPLRKPVNKALLGLMKTEVWADLLNRYAK